MCRKQLSSEASLKQHKDKYCKYRDGKKAKLSRVDCHRRAVNIDDGEIEFWSEDNDDDSFITRTRCSVNGRAREYEMVSCHDVVDPERWIRAEESLVRTVFEQMDEFLVRGRLVLRAWFVKRNVATGEVLRREMMYLSSLPADFIHDFHQWYFQHTTALIRNLNNLTKGESNLEYDGIEALEIKLNLLPNLSGRTFFQLPDVLKRKHAVVNVQTNEACFKYALLSILHYSDLNQSNRRYPSNYARWLGELDFGEVDESDVSIKDVRKIEELNNIKINIHVWEKGLQGCVYNDAKNLSSKTINLLLIVNSQGERHYCGIPSLSRLYRHTKTTHHYQHMCERCIRSFDTQQHLDEHFQWCSRGRLQLEQTQRNKIHIQFI